MNHKMLRPFIVKVSVLGYFPHSNISINVEHASILKRNYSHFVLWLFRIIE